MSVALSPFAGAGWQFFDNNGVPLIGGLLYTYAAGTTSPATTWIDNTQTTANSNPIVLDSAGRLPQEVWLQSGSSYKFVLKTSVGTTLGTYDNIDGLVSAAYVTGLFAAPPAIGNTTRNTGAFTTLALTTPLAPANGGTGATSTPTNGQLLIGNGVNFSVASLTAGAGITLTAGSGTLQLDVASSAIAAVKGGFANLKASATGASATITVTADELVLSTTGNAYATVRAVSLSVSGATSGANGLDTGTLAASTWYFLFAIYNGTTVAGLLSTSATAPTLPSGYTYFARVGAIRTDGTANKYPLGFKQYNCRVHYLVGASTNVTALPLVASGTAGTAATAASTTCALVASSVSTFVPTTAATIKLTGVRTDYTTNALSFQAAPNINYTNGFQCPLNGMGNQYNQPNSLNSEFALESTNVYWASNGAGAELRCIGWEDNL